MQGSGFRPILLMAGALACSLVGAATAEQKMKIEELVARHLDALGTAEARAAAKNRVLEGQATVTFRLGHTGYLTGGSLFASEFPRLRWSMVFGHLDYPGEQFVYDGSSVEEATLHAGVRSELASLIHDYDFLLKEGLLGGTTTTAWCLLDLAERQARLQYGGLKKIDGQPLHEVSYKARKGQGDFKVRLYFNPESFLHVLTLNDLKIAPYMARSPEESAGQRDTYWRVREEFGDHRAVDGLMVPHSYKLVLTYDGQNQTMLTEWKTTFTRVRHNVELTPADFTVRK